MYMSEIVVDGLGIRTRQFWNRRIFFRTFRKCMSGLITILSDGACISQRRFECSTELRRYTQMPFCFRQILIVSSLPKIFQLVRCI